MNTVDTPIYRLQRGTAPVLISIPHLGTHLPDDLRAGYTEAALQLADTDWHLDRLYAFAHELGIGMLSAKVSRYVIDLNRPASGESLYPGQATTGLCPTETFHGEPLYHPDAEPDDAEVARRVHTYWQPYHQALADELARLRAQHGQVLLWEAHSIASRCPRLFDGKLPDLNFGTHSGAACSNAVLDAVLAPLTGKNPQGRASPNPPPEGVESTWGGPALTHGGLTHVVNGRFKGGWITRHFGQPQQGIHAIQLEMCQNLYMDETAPFGWREDQAEAIQPVLRSLLESALAHFVA